MFENPYFFVALGLALIFWAMVAVILIDFL
jgi:hypothetical protein